MGLTPRCSIKNDVFFRFVSGSKLVYFSDFLVFNDAFFVQVLKIYTHMDYIQVILMSGRRQKKKKKKKKLNLLIEVSNSIYIKSHFKVFLVELAFKMN